MFSIETLLDCLFPFPFLDLEALPFDPFRFPIDLVESPTMSITLTATAAVSPTPTIPEIELLAPAKLKHPSTPLYQSRSPLDRFFSFSS